MKRLLSKKIFLLSAGLILGLACYAKKAPITKKELPTQAQKFINSYFKSETILYVMKDAKVFTTEYKVRMQSGIEIEFNEDGTWDEIEGHGLPLTFLPSKVKTYVEQKFPNATVTTIEKKRRGYEVELNDDIELYFDNEGNFTGMDD